MTPTRDYILIRPSPPENKTASGLLLPSSTLPDGDMQGVVIALGKDAHDDIQTGDTVLYTQYGMNEVQYQEKRHHLVREVNIYAKLNA